MATTTEALPDVAARARRRRRIRARIGAWLPAAILLLMLLAGFFAPLPFDPVKPDPSSVTLPPSGVHWFGTDLSGFDVFARTIASAAHVLPLVIVGTLLSIVVGVPCGLLASSRGRGAEVLVRALDGFQAFPLLVLAIALVTLAGNNLWSVVIAIGVVNTPRFMRLVRSQALVVRETRYIEAATAVGCSPTRVMLRHVFPNVVDSIAAQASLAAAYSVIVIASLNFLGIGVSRPTPTWGSMIQDGAQTVSQGYWWMIVFPSLAVLIAVVCFNALADRAARFFSAEN